MWWNWYDSIGLLLVIFGAFVFWKTGSIEFPFAVWIVGGIIMFLGNEFERNRRR